MSRNRLAWLLAVLILALGISTCAPAPSTPAPLSLDALENAEYQSEFPISKKAKLTNGTFQEVIVPGAASKLTITLLEQYAVGDLDNNGVADAVVCLATDTGGSGTFIYLASVLNDGGNPKHVASVSLGDRVQVKSAAIKSGEIVVDTIKHGPNDPMCCPTQQATQKFKLQDGKLISVN